MCSRARQAKGHFPPAPGTWARREAMYTQLVSVCASAALDTQALDSSGGSLSSESPASLHPRQRCLLRSSRPKAKQNWTIGGGAIGLPGGPPASDRCYVRTRSVSSSFSPPPLPHNPFPNPSPSPNGLSLFVPVPPSSSASHYRPTLASPPPPPHQEAAETVQGTRGRRQLGGGGVAKVNTTRCSGRAVPFRMREGDTERGWGREEEVGGKKGKDK